MTGEEHERRDERQDHAREERDGDAPADADAEQQGELHVAHPHTARVGERHQEEEEPRAEAGGRPFDTWVAHELQREHCDGSGNHDLVRDDAPFDIRRRDRDERDAEEHRGKRVQRRPEGKHAGATSTAVISSTAG